MVLFLAVFVVGIVISYTGFGVFMIIIGALYAFIVGPILFAGLKILKPNEALVLTLFGEYYGTLKGPGFYFVNPFVSAINPATQNTSTGSLKPETAIAANAGGVTINAGQLPTKKISLKATTLNNDKQKINDQLGNPIIIGIVVIWKVVNTAKAVFNVDNYTEFLSIQCDSALRDIVRLYPYDLPEDNEEKSLRSSSHEVAEMLKKEIKKRVEGAVGMVEMALEKLNENDIVHLDEERKASMVSNLLVVLCGSKDVQPIVNSGSIY